MRFVFFFTKYYVQRKKNDTNGLQNVASDGFPAQADSRGRLAPDL